jgi:hypothetical protein
MDLLYVVGKNSLWENNELKFSLRSAERHLKFNKVFIIGYKPPYLNEKAIHIFAPDNTGHKYTNVAAKIKFLLGDERIPEEFIFMNDDFFLLKDYDPVPYFFNKTIRDWIEHYPFNKGRYYKEIKKLGLAFPEGKYFELHFPIVYKKAKAKAVIEKYKMELTLMLRSYYCNEYMGEISPLEESRDYKIYTDSKIAPVFESAPFVSSTNQIALSGEFKSKLLLRFPKKSKYEN